MSMIEYRCDHVHLRSLDPAAAAQFYAHMFGAKIIGEMETPTAFRVTLNLGGLTVFIDRVPAGTHGPLPPPALGVEHIGLVVPDLEEAVRELEAKGAEFTLRPTSPRPGTKIAFLRAPDGAQIEILERATR
jgi:catechol 2,3-dioxygenase-like lactoylglutathione lyase family enzyme